MPIRKSHWNQPAHSLPLSLIIRLDFFRWHDHSTVAVEAELLQRWIRSRMKTKHILILLVFQADPQVWSVFINPSVATLRRLYVCVCVSVSSKDSLGPLRLSLLRGWEYSGSAWLTNGAMRCVSENGFSGVWLIKFSFSWSENPDWKGKGRTKCLE